MTNDMMRIKDDSPKAVKSSIDIQKEEILKQIDVLEKVKKEKLKELLEKRNNAPMNNCVGQNIEEATENENALSPL